MRALQLVVTDEADEDINRILDYVAGFNPPAALTLIEKIKRQWALLLNSPLMGRKRDDIASGIRSVILEKYQIFYRYDGELIEVLRMIHGAQDLQEAFSNKGLQK